MPCYSVGTMTDVDADNGQWITIREAIIHFGKGERTIHRWMKIGRLETKKVGHRTYVKVTDYQPTVETETTEETPPNVEKLQAQVEKLQTVNDILTEQIADIKADRDNWRGQAAALTAQNQMLIEAETSTKPAETGKKPWWKFW